jgi:sugar lactone lactonase YvrE
MPERMKPNFGIYLFFFLAAPFVLPLGLQAQPVRGQAGDLWADKILGQTDFSETHFEETTSKNLYNPESVFVDSLHDQFYLWDSGNNRILVVQDVTVAANGQGADLVLGQKDFAHGACNGDSNWQTFNWTTSPDGFYSPPVLPTQSCLCGLGYQLQSPAEAGSAANMATDSQGNLYVPDYYNNRVLRFNYPIYTGEPASYVWGQLANTGTGTPQFNYQAYDNNGSNSPGTPNSTNLGFWPPNYGDNGTLWWYSAGVAIDQWNNLWVADGQNNRVLRFPNGPGNIPSTTADTVLGQQDFNSNGANSNVNNTTSFPALQLPMALRVDASGNVYVCEANNAVTPPNSYGRISIFQPTGTNASGVPVYANGLPTQLIIASDTSQPLGIEIDPNLNSPTQVGIWVVDHGLVSGVSTYPVYEYQVNWPTFSYSTLHTITTGRECWGSAGVAQNGDLYVCGIRDMEVVRYPKANSYSPGIDLFAQPAGYGGTQNKIGDVGFWNSESVIVASPPGSGVTQVIAGDGIRIHFWDMPSAGPEGLQNGQPEDGYAGTNQPYAANFSLRTSFGQTAVDPTGKNLWVLEGSTPSRVDVFSLPLTGPSAPEATPVATLAQPLPVLGNAAQVSWTGLSGLTMDTAGNLWITDEGHNRVMRVRNPMGVAPNPTPVVDIILGQPNATSTDCNGNGTSCPGGTEISASTLNTPGKLKMDHHGDLFVSDDWLEFIGNFRLLRFDAKSLPANPASCVFGIPADGVYGTGGSFTTAASTPYDNAFWEVAFNSNDSVMVAGTNSQVSGGYPPVIIQNPLNGVNPAGTPDVPGAGDNPTGHLYDYGPQSFGLNFDSQDNLYVAELNRSRVLVYYQPFIASTPTPTMTPTPALPLANTVSCASLSSWTNPEPTGLAVDSAGNVYVVDDSTNLVDVYTGAGAFIRSVGSGHLSSPAGVAVDGSGNIYVTDEVQSIYTSGSVQYQVDVFNGITSGTPGAFSTSWGTSASAAGLWGNPVGIAANSAGASLYVADQNTGVIQVFGPGGTALTQWGSSGTTGDGTFGYPVGVALDASGKVYVADEDTNLLQVFTPQGGWITQWDVTQGTELLTAQSVAVYQNLVYVTDGFGEVGIFDTTGDPLGSVVEGSAGPFFDTEGVAVAGNGTWYVADLENGRIDEFAACIPTPTPTPGTPTITYTPTTTYSPLPTWTTTSTGTPTPGCCIPDPNWTKPAFSQAAGVAVDMSRQRVYAPDRGTGSLYAFTYTGSAVPAFGTGGVVTGLSAFSVAVGSCDYDGVYLMQRSPGMVIKLDSNGNTVWSSSAMGGGSNRSIYVDNSGTIYVCTDGGSIYLLDSTGTLQNTLTGYGFSAPTGTFKMGSTLYVDDTVNNRIVALPQTGAYTYGTASVVVPSVTSPYVLTQDLAGNYYVASSNANSYYVFNSAWTLSFTCTNGTLLAGAYGIAVDQTGAVYVAGQTADTVAKMEPCPQFPQPAYTVCPGTFTATPTPTLTATNSLTPTASPSNTPSITFTPTPSPTPTQTPTVIMTFTPTNSPTLAPSTTSTSSPTATLTSTFSTTPTPSATSSATSTPSLTNTPGRITPTATLTATPSLTQVLVWPNPAKNGTVQISPNLASPSDVNVKVFTLAFRRVIEREFPQVQPGAVLTITLTDDWGGPLANGLYYVVFSTPQNRIIRKLIVLR